MKTFPKNVTFKYNWRKYQQRVLDELDAHLANDHLHIVAPPGSGKTVLGIEVAIRINKPVLILAPTTAIKYQWIQRLRELFLQTTETPDWVSTNIREPNFFTVATYQGLHAACNRLVEIEYDSEESETDDDVLQKSSTNTDLDKIATLLKKCKVGTFILDEAHHLKNEWWHTLIKLKDELSPTVVGLTATPPYDVSFTEWQRYIELNGPVDSEISVPELIKEGDLCPHQDFVYFTQPTLAEYESIVKYRENIESLFNELKADDLILKAFDNHPAWLFPADNSDWIFNNISYYSSLLIFLNANGREIPRTHLELIGTDEPTLPRLDYPWMETVLEFFNFGDPDIFKHYEDYRTTLENKLRRHSALTGKKISLNNANRVASLLTSSVSKLKAVEEVVNFEYELLGSGLRMVVLSDYIRKEFLTGSTNESFDLTKMGVVPIFETLRRNNKTGKKLGLLTGSLVVIPTHSRELFKQKAAKEGITDLNLSLLSSDDNYSVVKPSEQNRSSLVSLVTQIFEEGGIEVLIGTKSLLGEGWDAPAINSLLIASVVGSFVLSNQMRGRAIRIDKRNPGKTANIWHLACIDPTISSGGSDIELLRRRFKSFIGISLNSGGGIENGIERLKLPTDLSFAENILATNKEIQEQASKRQLLKTRWDAAIKNGTGIVEEIKIPFPKEKNYKREKHLYYSKTIAYLGATLVTGLLYFILDWLITLLRNSGNIRSIQDLYIYLAAILFFGSLTFGTLTYKTFRLYTRYRDIAKDIKGIADALLLSLIKAGAIQTEIENLRVIAEKDPSGSVYCRLVGGTTHEKSIFINALMEIITPINNPRYLIIRKSRLLFVKQKDYHAVPEVIGRKKSRAEYFSGLWRKMVGNCEVIFTRNEAGRKILLQARIKALSAQIDETIQPVSQWR